MRKEAGGMVGVAAWDKVKDIVRGDLCGQEGG